MRAHLTPRLVTFLVCLGASLAAHGEIAVIVHPENPVHAMTPREVSDLYLGRTRSFDRGDQKSPLPASVFELPASSPLREAFFRALNGMSLSQLNAYWARLRFSGEVLPPVALTDSKSITEVVSRNKSAIGYVDAAAVSDAVKVVLRLKE